MLDENFFGWSPDDARELFVRLHVVEEPSKLKEMQAIYKYIDLLLPFISTAALVSSMQLFLDTGGSNNVDDNYLPTVVRGLIPISIVLAGIIDLFIENTCIYIMISQFLVDGSFSGIISNIGGYATFLKWVFALYLPVPSSLIIIWVNQQHGNKEKIS